LTLPEHQILKLLLTKDIYLRYNKYIYNIINKNNNNILYNILKSLEALQSKTDKSPSLADLHVEFLIQNPHLPQKERDQYDLVFNLIAQAEAKPEAVEELLANATKTAKLNEIALKAFEAAASGKGEDEVVNLVNSLSSGKNIAQPDGLEFVTFNLDELYTAQVQKPGLRWRLASLNQSLGSLRRGDLGVVFARPETGKTTFLASEASYMAQQATSPVLWFNNEQEGKVVSIRIIQAALGIPLEKLFSNRARCQQEFDKLTKGNFKLVDDANLSKQFVEKVVAYVKPSLIIVDQLDKIKGFQSDRTDLELGAIYQWARELAKTYAPVIGVCQADGTAEGVRWLNMGHMANAKTAKQAECDWILGIGYLNNPDMENVRHFAISKNKLFGDTDSLQQMRHGRWDVIIEPEIARYKDYVK